MFQTTLHPKRLAVKIRWKHK